MPLPPSEPAESGPIAQRLWRAVVLATDLRQRRLFAAGTLLLVFVIGVLDYLSGIEISLFVFYCLPVVLGTAALGWRFGVVTAFTCVAAGLASDFLAGAHFRSLAVPGWNALIALSTYLVIVWLFATVRALQQEMQERVRQRTAALTAGIAERERLEKALLEISERERASIGRELHDDLGQHLTGTAFACQVLGEKLQALGLPEHDDARQVVDLIEEGIEKTRHLAKGLLLAEIPADGLPAALRGLAADASTRMHGTCEFQTEGDCRLAEPGAAMHLLRIAQEAVNNAIRHGRARRIVIILAGRPDYFELTIRDDGSGLPAVAERGQGLGLHIMAHRAQIIGGEFSIESKAGGGTMAHCRLPQASVADAT